MIALNFLLQMLVNNIEIEVFKIPYVFLQLHSCRLKENFLFSSRFKFASVTRCAAKRLKFNMPPENGSSVTILYCLLINIFFEQLKTCLITSLNNVTLLLFVTSKKNRKIRFILDFYSGVTP